MPHYQEEMRGKQRRETEGPLGLTFLSYLTVLAEEVPFHSTILA